MTKRQTNRTSTPRRVICLTPLQEARVAEVFAAAELMHGLTRQQLMDQNKSQRFHIVAIRHEVMLALYLTGLTKAEIGRLLCRDISTVVHGLTKVDGDETCIAHARTMAHANRRADLPRLLRNALPHEPEGNIRAIEHYLTVCVLGEWNRHATAAACAWGLYLLQQSRRGEHVAEALVSCGLEHGARLLAGILARDVRRAS